MEEIRELPPEEIKRYNYDKNGQDQPRRFFHNENEDDSANDNAKEEDEDGNEDTDEDEDGDSSADERDLNYRVGMRPPHRGGGGVAEKKPPKFGGQQGPGQGDDNEIRRDRRGDQGPIEGIRHAMGHDDASMHFFKNVEKNGNWK